MGLISWLFERLGWRSSRAVPSVPVNAATEVNTTTESLPGLTTNHLLSSSNHAAITSDNHFAARTVDQPPVVAECESAVAFRSGRVRLVATRHRRSVKPPERSLSYVEVEGSPPYRYARYGSRTGHYLDLSRDGDEQRLQQFQLPVFHTPEELADWLDLPLNKIAWLVHRFSNGRPASVKDAHYHYHWIQKRKSGWRLIESPKSILKLVQTRLLRGLLDRVPPHSAAHGFTVGRSIVTNAKPHVGSELLLKMDLENFYPTVTFARVVAIFRSLGYSREVAIWLGLLTTSTVPTNLGFRDPGPYVIVSYTRRHLPQGAPTSPALANLSAFGLDMRLAGLARCYGATYTRYADDLTFSGPANLSAGLRTLIPVVQRIVRQERFRTNSSKTRVLRAHQRLTVTGVVVNEKTNVARHDFDRLKAILTNCLRHGPSTQNRNAVDDFYHHLQGRIAHLTMLNPARGARLAEIFRQIDWTK